MEQEKEQLIEKNVGKNEQEELEITIKELVASHSRQGDKLTFTEGVDLFQSLVTYMSCYIQERPKRDPETKQLTGEMVKTGMYDTVMWNTTDHAVGRMLLENPDPTPYSLMTLRVESSMGTYNYIFFR